LNNTQKFCSYFKEGTTHQLDRFCYGKRPYLFCEPTESLCAEYWVD